MPHLIISNEKYYSLPVFIIFTGRRIIQKLIFPSYYENRRICFTPNVHTHITEQLLNMPFCTKHFRVWSSFITKRIAWVFILNMKEISFIWKWITSLMIRSVCIAPTIFFIPTWSRWSELLLVGYTLNNRRNGWCHWNYFK